MESVTPICRRTVHVTTDPAIGAVPGSESQPLRDVQTWNAGRVSGTWSFDPKRLVSIWMRHSQGSHGHPLGHS